MSKLNDYSLAYLMLRLIFGIDMFGHGFVRVSGRYTKFHDATFDELSKSILPDFLISASAWAIPPLELIFGLMVLSGYRLRWGLIGNCAVLFTLIFGACMVENWRAVNVILLQALVCCILIAFRSHNSYSMDSILEKTKRN
mgnify:CR=1 FL=1